MTEPVLKTPEEWEREYDVVVLDADGWRRDGKPFEEPIDHDEFMSRACASTVRNCANLSRRRTGTGVTS